ncbi:MAG: hypothetical protein ER33_09805 [Cyanobium sp. CACIAM 14]|nr:MAG: hypothetical protein ER33_09805 [Cyanobium sp. CACIAM 14]
MAASLSTPFRIAVLAVALGAGGAALAQTAPSEPGRPTPAQLQKIFPEQKRLAISDHQARITILQNGERCLGAAGSSEALRACMKQEREAYQRQREQHRAEIKVLFERNGIPLPEWGRGDRRWKWGEGRPGNSGV